VLEAGLAPGVLLECPVSPLERGAAFAEGLADLCPADFIERIVGKALHVKAIEDDAGTWRGCR